LEQDGYPGRRRHRHKRYGNMVFHGRGSLVAPKAASWDSGSTGEIGSIVSEDLKARVSKVEWTQERQEERLNQGAESFSDVRQSVDDLKGAVHKLHGKIQAVRAPRPVPWTWVAGFGFSVVVAFSGILWTLAQYPDGEAFGEAQEVNAKAHKSLDVELDGLKAAQNGLATEQKLSKQSLDTQAASLKSIDRKLDRLLLPPKER